jgi:hypothetical protein
MFNNYAVYVWKKLVLSKLVVWMEQISCMCGTNYLYVLNKLVVLVEQIIFLSLEVLC